MEALTVACTEEELRAAMKAAVPHRRTPTVAGELEDARERLRLLKARAAVEARELAREEARELEAREESKELASREAADRPTCVICLDASPTRVFVPCGHRTLCEKCCAENLASLGGVCPTCRGLFSSVIHVFD